jgi:hypothetical protein
VFNHTLYTINLQQFIPFVKGANSDSQKSWVWQTLMFVDMLKVSTANRRGIPPNIGSGIIALLSRYADIDRLAFDMLQFLYQYKKREFIRLAFIWLLSKNISHFSVGIYGFQSLF